MRTRLLLTALALVSLAKAQDTTQVTTVTRATFLSPGFSYETPVGPKQTLFAQAYLGASVYYTYSMSMGTDAGIYFNPAFNAQYRYYFNIAKRRAQGKRTDMNSGNYIAPVVEVAYYSFKDKLNDRTQRDLTYQVGAVWGLQRNLPKRFSLDLNIGPSLLFTKEYVLSEDARRSYKQNVTKFSIFGQFNLGFWLNKQK